MLESNFRSPPKEGKKIRCSLFSLSSLSTFFFENFFFFFFSLSFLIFDLTRESQKQKKRSDPKTQDIFCIDNYLAAFEEQILDVEKEVAKVILEHSVKVTREVV